MVFFQMLKSLLFYIIAYIFRIIINSFIVTECLTFFCFWIHFLEIYLNSIDPNVEPSMNSEIIYKSLKNELKSKKAMVSAKKGN